MEWVGPVVGLATAGATYWIMKDNTDQIVDGTTHAAWEAGKVDFISNCLLVPTNTPLYCRQRADEAFSPHNQIHNNVKE